MPPETISHYNVLGELGRGGMGVVYKASDTKLNRTVALKVLPQHMLTTQDDRARFYREARSAAALHHPNIATVFEIDEHEDQPFIAIEFVDGQSLQDRISDGPLPLKEAVSIASQIAEGLKEAHAANIVHRDIKSANVMLTKDGKAKILDFGLAKTAASTKLTQMGSTLGTVAYMSPQQARGEDVDHRTDLWSLGAVMYEMISGKLPFPGDFEQAVVYSILNEEPKPLTSVRTGVPMGLEWIVSKLLAKDPEDRYQSAADLLVDLRTVDLSAAGLSRIRAVPSTASETAAATGTTTATKSSVRTIAALFLGLLLGSAGWLFWPRQEVEVERSVKRFEVPLVTRSGLTSVDISPDGSKIVYADLSNTVDNVRVLDLMTGSVRIVENSRGTLVVSVSPDGNWLLLTKDLSIDRVSMLGGTPLTVTTTTEGLPRASWGPADWVVFENEQAIWKASTSGGHIGPLTRKDSTAGEVDHDWPQMLPDGKTMMATIEYLNSPSVIGFWDVDTGERKGQIPFAGYRVRYVRTGHLLFVLGGQTGDLVALPFDLGSLRATGSPIAILTNVSTAVPTVSQGGTLVTGGIQGGEVTQQIGSILTAVTFPGILRPLGYEKAKYRGFELSPDGARLAAQINTVQPLENRGLVETGDDVFVLDLAKGNKVQLTFGGSGSDPTWLPGGDSVAYIDRANLATKVMIRAANGSGNPRELLSIQANIFDLDISPDGTRIAYALGQSGIGVTRILVRNLKNGNTVDLSGTQDANLRNPRFSPDGRYVAYESGSYLLVRAADGSGVPIYVGQARLSRWSPDGTKLYASGSGNVSLFAYNVTLKPSFSAGSAEPIAPAFGSFDLMDVFPDGRSAIVNLSNIDETTGRPDNSASRDTTVSVVVTVNWFETLK